MRLLQSLPTHSATAVFRLPQCARLRAKPAPDSHYDSCDERRSNSESKNSPVETESRLRRNVEPQRNRTDRPSSDLSEEQAAESSTERQHHALSEKLTDQAAALCSERRSNRHFAFANRGAHQQEVRYVRARQQQDQSREALEEYGSNQSSVLRIGSDAAPDFRESLDAEILVF